MPSRTILAIDLGTSIVKVALVASSSELIGWVAEPHPICLLPKGGAEQDPEIWWQTLTKAIHRLWHECPLPREQIGAIACTAQWSGTVAVDPTGNPLRPAILWLDTRGAPYIAELIGGFPSFQGYHIGKLWTWLRLTGGAPAKSGKDPIAHILYLKHEEPNIFAETYQFLEPKDYLNLRLTGQFASTYETVTLHWLTDNRSLQKVDYHPTLLHWACIPREKLPPLYPNTAIVGTLQPEVARQWDLPNGIPVIGGTPDLHASAIGSGAVRDFQAHMALSTSAWMSCHVPFKRTDVFHNLATLPAGIPQRYFIANEQETAGACLTFLRDSLFFPDSAPPNAYQQMDTWASEVQAGSEGLLFAPWLFGERTPVENHSIRGGFHGLSLNHHRGHIVRAVLEGVALNAKWLLRYVERIAGCRLEPIRLIGGGARSALWCRIIASVLNREVWQMAEPQFATVRGVAMLASAALGWSDWEYLAQSVPCAQRFAPDSEDARHYEALFREFLAYYKHAKAHPPLKP